MSKLRKTPEEKDAASFRYWVHGTMKDRGESCEDLGLILGISGAEVSRKLNGTHHFTLEQAIAVIHHFGEPYTLGVKQ